MTERRPFYNVLEPNFYPTGRFFTGYDRYGRLLKQEFYAVGWNIVGQAHDMADAKRQFGGHPVLEQAVEVVGFERQQKLLHRARREEAAQHDHYQKASRASNNR